MGKLKTYLQPYWGFIILTVLIKFTGTALELLIPYLMEIIIDFKVPAGQLGSHFAAGSFRF